MPCLGLTGGIATGKSSFAAALATQLPAEIFDADLSGHRLMARNEEVREAIREKFGPAVFISDGSIDRARLREVVFHDESKRRQLEAILHPAIRSDWLGLVRTRQGSVSTSKNGWLIVDIPLLFETAVESNFDAVIVVACPPATQRQRLTGKRGLPGEMAVRMMSAQFDLSEKMKKADHVIWNDGKPAHLDAQALLLARFLRRRHGHG